MTNDNLVFYFNLMFNDNVIIYVKQIYYYNDNSINYEPLIFNENSISKSLSENI